jgi:hypothetical protein
MAKKTHEKMLTITSHKEMQIKTTLRFHLPLFRITTIQEHHQQMLVRMRGKRNLHTLLLGMYTNTITMENYGGSLKKYK